MMIKVITFVVCLLLSPAAVSASTLDTEPIEGMTTEAVLEMTTEAATSQPGEASEETIEEEPVFLEKDEGLLQFKYIDEVYTVVTNVDIYVMLVRIYNLLLFFLWTVISMFVINRVFEAFRPAYKVSKE